MKRLALLALFCLTTTFFVGCGDIVVMTNQPTEATTEATTEAPTEYETTSSGWTVIKKSTTKIDGHSVTMSFKEKNDKIEWTFYGIASDNEKACAMMYAATKYGNTAYSNDVIQAYTLSVSSSETGCYSIINKMERVTTYLTKEKDGTVTADFPKWIEEQDYDTMMEKYSDYITEILYAIRDFPSSE